MIRITVHSEVQGTRLVLEGKLSGPRVDELRKCWQQVISSPPPSVQVNLTDLTEIDSEGKELLAQLHHQGAKLIGSGVMVEALIEEIVRGQDDQN
ncbi:MAG: STAS domain-containing protein [bacterium]